LNSKNINLIILKWLLLLVFVYIAFILFKNFGKSSHQEGFTQIEPFVLKQNETIYDDFYSQVYDEIHKPLLRTDFELNNIIKMTEPTRNSIFLDIGSGTGDLVNELKEAGYQAYGIDKSQTMINISETKHPKNDYKCGDAMEPMTFEKNTFSHILCTYFTIYQIQDKRTFIRNCYHWLIPNGYLIIHLVDKSKFDTIMPVCKSKLIFNPNIIHGSRIHNSIVDFGGFEYKSSYEFKENENKVVLREKFQDKATNKIRQNEQTLYMENLDNIVNIILSSGFSLKSKINMKTCIDDENQFIYIFERLQ
jgi:ubiquinone/menaquinone biosynthesis C-methylase UbiE